MNPKPWGRGSATSVTQTFPQAHPAPSHSHTVPPAACRAQCTKSSAPARPWGSKGHFSRSPRALSCPAVVGCCHAYHLWARASILMSLPDTGGDHAPNAVCPATVLRCDHAEPTGDGVPASQLERGPATGTVAICGVTQRIEDGTPDALSAP